MQETVSGCCFIAVGSDRRHMLTGSNVAAWVLSSYPLHQFLSITGIYRPLPMVKVTEEVR